MGKSESSGANSNMGFNQSYINRGQRDNLNELWDAGNNGILRNEVGAANQPAQNEFLSNLRNNPYNNSAAGFMDYMGNAQQQIGALKSSLKDQYLNTLLPQISDVAQQGGALGGGRQGVAQGMANNGMQMALAQGGSNILNNSYNQAQQASQFMTQQYTGQQLAGIEGLQGIQQQQLAPLLALAQILGNPTVMQKSGSFGSGRTASQSNNSSFLGG
jgi:hypothetical protein